MAKDFAKLMKKDPELMYELESGEYHYQASMIDKPQPACLVGKWFLQFKGKDLGWQGEILAMPRAETYLVQLFSWLDGGPTDQVFVKLEDMTEWKFYDTIGDMKFAAEYRYSPKD